jgi:hypothetical protein
MASSGMDYKAHERTYSGFLVLFKWGTIASILAAAAVVALLVF